MSGLGRGRRRRVDRFTLKVEELRKAGSYQWIRPYIPEYVSLKL